MTSFIETSTQMIAKTVCGAYLIVAFSDGRYDKSEEVGMVVGLFEKNTPAGVSKADLEAALPELEQAFQADYDLAANRVLEMARSLRDNGLAKRAIMHAARTAVIADRAVAPQEESAMDRISEALGLKTGEL
jgi:tellurite resistance protein